MPSAHVAIQFRSNFGYFPPRDHNQGIIILKVINESCYFFLSKSKGATQPTQNGQWDALTPKLNHPQSHWYLQVGKLKLQIAFLRLCASQVKVLEVRRSGGMAARVDLLPTTQGVTHTAR